MPASEIRGHLVHLDPSDPAMKAVLAQRRNAVALLKSGLVPLLRKVAGVVPVSKKSKRRSTGPLDQLWGGQLRADLKHQVETSSSPRMC